MPNDLWILVSFTVRMALLSTVLVFPVGLALAWALSRPGWRGKTLVETLVTLPLVVPPVVTGLILLKGFGRRGPVGHWLYERFGAEIVFTWRAVVLALAVMSLPLLVRAARHAFEQVNPLFENMARTLGAGEWRVFFTISVPLARNGIVGGLLLAFARALGEFGATIVVAGNIPGRTTTLSVAIYQHIQAGDDTCAWGLVAISVALAFGAVWGSELLLRRNTR